MPDKHPLAQAADDLVTVLRTLRDTWTDLDDTADRLDRTGGLQQQLVTLAYGYPLGKDISDLTAEAEAWADHVDRAMTSLPQLR